MSRLRRPVFEKVGRLILPATALPCENAYDGRTIGGDGYGQAAEVCVGSLEDAASFGLMVGTFHLSSGGW
jgi:hypothetical protein